MGVWGQSPTPIICQDGAQELIKIDEEIGGEGGKKVFREVLQDD